MGKETLDTGIERNPDINRFENEEVGLEKQTVESVKDAYLTAHRILSKSFKIKDGDPPRHNLGKHNHQFEKGGYLITITVTIGSAKDDFRNTDYGQSPKDGSGVPKDEIVRIDKADKYGPIYQPIRITAKQLKGIWRPPSEDEWINEEEITFTNMYVNGHTNMELESVGYDDGIIAYSRIENGETDIVGGPTLLMTLDKITPLLIEEEKALTQAEEEFDLTGTVSKSTYDNRITSATTPYRYGGSARSRRRRRGKTRRTKAEHAEKTKKSDDTPIYGPELAEGPNDDIPT